MAAVALGTAGPPAEPDPRPQHAKDAVLYVPSLVQAANEAAFTPPLSSSYPGERRGGMIIPEHSSLPDAAPAVDPLENRINSEIQKVRSNKKAPSIWRVHPSIRDEEPEVYTPKLISIGPLHHQNENLLPMETIKLSYLDDLLGRCPDRNKLGNYVKEMRTNESQARSQYAEAVKMDSEEFVRMLVLDGCFIIEHFLKRFFKKRQEVGGVRRSWAYLRRDLMLLENQIPFFVLVALFEKCTIPLEEGKPVEGKREELLTLMKIAPAFLKIKEQQPVEGVRKEPLTLMEIALAFLKIKELQTKHHPMSGQVLHLLHLHHLCLDPTRIKKEPRRWSSRRVVAYPLKKTVSLISLVFIRLVFIGLLYLLMTRKCHWWCPRTKKKAPRMIPCATELSGAGIKFEQKVLKSDWINTYLKVSFKEGTLKIPYLCVQESTISELRNFIALEQCCPLVGSHFTSYVVFMDNIINTEGDVAILRKCGIIESKLGSDEEVAKMFNALCKGTDLHYRDHYNAALFKAVREYCELPHHEWRADLVRTYFSNPWSIFSVVAAIVLLGLTVTQTYFAINPRK